LPGAGTSVVLVSAEDVILLKLEWYRLGGESPSVQRRDVRQLVDLNRDVLDIAYLRQWESMISSRPRSSDRALAAALPRVLENMTGPDPVSRGLAPHCYLRHQSHRRRAHHVAPFGRAVHRRTRRVCSGHAAAAGSAVGGSCSRRTSLEGGW